MGAHRDRVHVPSLDPPLCLVCVGKNAGSHDAFVASRKFAVNVLTADQEHISNHFASRKEDKFAEVAHRARSETGCPILDGALASMECTLHEVLPGGDHDIFVGELQATAVAEGSPLLYFRGRYAKVAD
ncbi:MAG: flavin reductase family protein [Polyangiaceae bacterium]